jgi:hypothetical protein
MFCEARRKERGKGGPAHPIVYLWDSEEWSCESWGGHTLDSFIALNHNKQLPGQFSTAKSRSDCLLCRRQHAFLVLLHYDEDFQVC